MKNKESKLMTEAEARAAGLMGTRAPKPVKRDARAEYAAKLANLWRHPRAIPETRLGEQELARLKVEAERVDRTPNFRYPQIREVRDREAMIAEVVRIDAADPREFEGVHDAGVAARVLGAWQRETLLRDKAGK